jgi:uncharacterized membrane protein
MKIFGHPVHMMLVHFPSALLPMDFICSLIYFFTGDQSFLTASFYAGVAGVTTGWIAAFAGALDLIKIAEEKNHLVKKVLWHAGTNLTVVAFFTVTTYKHYTHYPELQSEGAFLLLLKGVALCILIIGNFIGGNLVLKDKVAMENE